MLLLTVENIKKKFGTKEVLRGASLKLRSGEFVSITGQNGSGKTVLVDIIIGLIQADSGKIEYWDHQPISTEIKEKIGVVNTTTRLFEYLTPLENIQFYSKIYGQYHNQTKIEELFALFDMEAYLTDKKTTMDRISSGQNVKVHLIKALVGQPRLLILDEPTAYLDKKSKRQIFSVFSKLRENNDMSCLMISHSQGLLKISDRILVMKNGKLE